MAIDYTKGMRPNLYELMQGASGGADKLNIDGSNADSEGFSIESQAIEFAGGSILCSGDSIVFQVSESSRFIFNNIAAIFNSEGTIEFASDNEIALVTNGEVNITTFSDINAVVDGDFKVRKYDPNVGAPVPYSADIDYAVGDEIITVQFLRDHGII